MPTNGSGLSTAGYWLRVILGALDDGLITAGGVFLGTGIGDAVTTGTIVVPLTKSHITFAVLLGAYTMFKNVRAYLKVPPVPPDRQNGPSTPAVPVP